MKSLVVIEAIGKKEALRKILEGLGHDVEVFATKGHFLRMPSDLSHVGIEASFREYARGPQTEADKWVRDKLRELAGQCSEVLIATDADSEGDVIAWDVMETVRDIHAEPKRVKLTAIESEAVDAAVRDASPVRKRDAVPGRTRATIDRLVGATFSGDGVAVGRVSTGLLGLLDRKKPARRKLRLVAPASDGGRPFVAETPVKKPLDKETAKRLSEFKFPPISYKDIFPQSATRPENMGDAMVSAGDGLDMSPREVASAMQRTYESGMLSYPRAGSRGMSDAAKRRLARTMAINGMKFSSDKVASRADGEVHDAPHPTGKFDPNADPKKMDADGAVVTHIGRRLVKTGQSHKVERGDTSKLKRALSESFSPEIVEFVMKLEWRREVGPKFPGKQAWPASELVERRADTVVLEAMVEAGLGKPSTWANHAETLIERGLVDDDLELTQKGRRWLDSAPEPLRNPATSIAIEKACDSMADKAMAAAEKSPDREPWEMLSERIVKALPEEISKPLKATAAREKAPEPEASPGSTPDIPELDGPVAPAYVPEEA